MKTDNRRKKKISGSVLVAVLEIMLLVSFSIFGIMGLSQYHYRKQGWRASRLDAFYTAENAMLEGIQMLADQNVDATVAKGTYVWSKNVQTLNLPYTPSPKVLYTSVKIEADPMGVTDNYLVTGTAVLSSRTATATGEQHADVPDGTVRTVRSLVRWHPPSLVFDYEYFLNNWGWWWGSTITGYGDQRSNWDFDFKDRPKVYGHIFANGQVASNKVPINPFTGTPPFAGSAGTNPLTYCHVGAPRIKMPNLKDLTYYETSATGTIKKNGATLINRVHGDNEPKPGIYLEGTDASPLVIDGNVVIRGDAIIKGTIKGKGTIYIGGNLYVAGDIKYSSATRPDFSTPPESMTPANRDAWVDRNMNKDLVCFAVRESIFGGKVNDSTWKSNCFDNTSYGLKYIGSEATLGADGIRGTPDDNIKYLDTNNDGIPDSAWYDADEDGVIDANYNYDTQIKMTPARINNIADYPMSGKNPVDYNSVATDQLTTFEGVYYTNHAFAVKHAKGPDYINGTIVCRDEAWIFSDSLNMRYDSRIHSRYQRKYFGGDPNRIIDLGLPIVEDVRILDRYEIPPVKKLL
ncbi:MAG: hypothetical protein BWY12_02041 [candidate division BRC1 bacterium ADurb.Bin183]|nr:MAG: hypothetical protein BWY12_02041 [candidate division BRC1 bacterium ADurb.Bin183]